MFKMKRKYERLHFSFKMNTQVRPLKFRFPKKHFTYLVVDVGTRPKTARSFGDNVLRPKVAEGGGDVKQGEKDGHDSGLQSGL